MASENPTPENPENPTPENVETPATENVDTTATNAPDFQSFASKKVAAGVCGILLGGFGVHKFILGINTPGIIMLVVSLACLVGGPFLCGLPWMANAAMSVIGLVEGIIYLTKTDQEFYELYAVQQKEWF